MKYAPLPWPFLTGKLNASSSLTFCVCASLTAISTVSCGWECQFFLAKSIKKLNLRWSPVGPFLSALETCVFQVSQVPFEVNSHLVNFQLRSWVLVLGSKFNFSFSLFMGEYVPIWKRTWSSDSCSPIFIQSRYWTGCHSVSFHKLLPW